jgi:hypothetical protein
VAVLGALDCEGEGALDREGEGATILVNIWNYLPNKREHPRRLKSLDSIVSEKHKSLTLCIC